MLGGTSRFACQVRRPRCHCSNYRLPRLNILCAEPLTNDRNERRHLAAAARAPFPRSNNGDACANKLALLSRFSPRKANGHRSSASLSTNQRLDFVDKVASLCTTELIEIFSYR